MLYFTIYVNANDYLCGKNSNNENIYCNATTYLTRGRPLVSPGRSILYLLEENVIPIDKRPCGLEYVLLFDDYFNEERRQFGYQTKLCNKSFYCGQ